MSRVEQGISQFLDLPPGMRKPRVTIDYHNMVPEGAIVSVDQAALTRFLREKHPNLRSLKLEFRETGVPEGPYAGEGGREVAIIYNDNLLQVAREQYEEVMIKTGGLSRREFTKRSVRQRAREGWYVFGPPGWPYRLTGVEPVHFWPDDINKRVAGDMRRLRAENMLPEEFEEAVDRYIKELIKEQTIRMVARTIAHEIEHVDGHFFKLARGTALKTAGTLVGVFAWLGAVRKLAPKKSQQVALMIALGPVLPLVMGYVGNLAGRSLDEGASMLAEIENEVRIMECLEIGSIFDLKVFEAVRSGSVYHEMI